MVDTGFVNVNILYSLIKKSYREIIWQLYVMENTLDTVREDSRPVSISVIVTALRNQRMILCGGR